MRVLGFAIAILAAAALFRTIGLALVAALAIWAALTRRRAWLIASVVAAAPTLVWMWRCSRTGAPTYVGAIADAIERLGPGGYASAALRQAGWYLARIPGLIFPGLSDARPVYERVLLDDAPSLSTPNWIGYLAAIGVLAAAAMGWRSGRDRGGALAALFTVVYLVVLAVYPPKHERLAWPIVPLLWVWAAVGMRDLLALWVRRLGTATRAVERGTQPSEPRAVVHRSAVAVVALCVMTVVALEAAGSVAMVRANRAFRDDGEHFHARRFPPGYYIDWQTAGRFIAADAPPYARVLTRHSDVGFGSKRYQDSIRFEEVAPRQWRSALATLPARFLVLPDARCGEGIRWQVFDGDPAYRYRARHHDKGAIVFEVTPNRDGLVAIPSPTLEREIGACRDAVASLPGRDDLRRRLAGLLGEAGRSGEGLTVLQPLTERADARAETWLTRGELLLDLDRLDEAEDSFARAGAADGAESLTNSIARGRRVAADRRARRSAPPAEQARLLVREGMDLLEALDPRAAIERVARAERLAPEDPEVLAARAILARRVGRMTESRAIFAHLAAIGDRAAATMLAEAEREATIGSRSDAEPSEWLRVARFQAGDGAPGLALATLEQASARFPGNREVTTQLADLYLYFGMAEAAEPLYRHLAGADRADGVRADGGHIPAVAARGLARCAALLQPADY